MFPCKEPKTQLRFGSGNRYVNSCLLSIGGLRDSLDLLCDRKTGNRKYGESLLNSAHVHNDLILCRSPNSVDCSRICSTTPPWPVSRASWCRLSPPRYQRGNRREYVLLDEGDHLRFLPIARRTAPKTAPPGTDYSLSAEGCCGCTAHAGGKK